MIRFLSIFLCISLSLQAMDIQPQPDHTSTLPDEITYKIIDLWPAINVYRLISKRWHALTSYTRADDIVGKLGPASLGNWDAQKLLLKYVRENKLSQAGIIFAQNHFYDVHDFTVNPYWYTPSTVMQELLQKHGILDEGDDENGTANTICKAAAIGDLKTIATDCDSSHRIAKWYATILNAALTNAIACDHLEIATFVLSKNINYIFPHITAADFANIDTVKQLCEQYSNLINNINLSGQSPFMQAIARGRLEIAKLFKKHGADIHRYNEECGLPLYHACLKGRGETVEFLLANGIKPDSVYTEGNRSFTPLWIAASENYVEIAQKLIAAGANVDWGTNKDAPDSYDSLEPIPTPLIQAAYNGHLKMVQLLVNAGAQIWNPQFNGKNARDTAHAQGQTHIVEWLDQYGFKA